MTNSNHLIFATSFSDACHAGIPSAARIVDALAARLTILHVYNPQKKTFREADSMLHSFFAEADNYPDCERQMISWAMRTPCTFSEWYCTSDAATQRRWISFTVVWPIAWRCATSKALPFLT